MSKRVYLNKPSGRGCEFWGCLCIAGLLAAAGMVVYLMFGGAMTIASFWAMLTGASGGSGLTPRHAFPLYSKNTAAEMNALFEIVRSSPHVTGSKMYSTIARNIQFVYDSGNDSINAFAWMEKTEDGLRPRITLDAGLVRFAQTGAVVLASINNGRMESTNLLVSIMCQMRTEWKGAMSSSNAIEFAARNGFASIVDAKILEEAKGIAAGMILASLAHEMGHQSLGHLHGGGYGNKRPEVSRNQEREADLFESSVMSESSFGQYMFEGELLNYLVFAALDGMEKIAGKKYWDRTHPYSRERLLNFMQQNQSKVAALKFSAEDIINMIPPKYEAVKGESNERHGP